MNTSNSIHENYTINHKLHFSYKSESCFDMYLNKVGIEWLGYDIVVVDGGMHAAY